MKILLAKQTKRCRRSTYQEDVFSSPFTLVNLGNLQQEYIRGISAWNFNLEDLKNQAALIQDYDEISNIEEPNANSKLENGLNDVGLPAERLSPDISDHSDNGSHHEVRMFQKELWSSVWDVLKSCLPIIIQSGIASSTPVSITSAASVVPYLQIILQQNTTQREELLKLIKFAEGLGTNGISQILVASPRERELQLRLSSYNKVLAVWLSNCEYRKQEIRSWKEI
ncbi:hypothetical protein L2E82_15708 [Cichorium intybus]|uniref:Uncharacterized protein n=1 Tax=Cichorium intybus TaxID=13427 RepID=A0ACB9F3Y5_CICIN|nr:hypothetical protein L2E82_15708 [Cichorium intybus]